MVRIKVEGGAEVQVVYVDDGSDDVIITGAVGAVEVGAGVSVSAMGATIGSVAVINDTATYVQYVPGEIKFISGSGSAVTLGRGAYYRVHRNSVKLHRHHQRRHGGS